jgi:hypothetical protein
MLATAPLPLAPTRPSIATLLVVVLFDCALGQEPSAPDEASTDSSLAAPKQVDVQPVAEDEEIEGRLLRILQATEWFDEPRVEVDEGVAFLRGRTQLQEHKEWATRLVRPRRCLASVLRCWRSRGCSWASPGEAPVLPSGGV